mmetsp:Transcript_106270/g.305559  ORF Transcript_106270/g.305559 Transcript_106270/m.305559 type:complete len:227 (+) Transcript_106270:507-1187(+)
MPSSFSDIGASGAGASRASGVSGAPLCICSHIGAEGRPRRRCSSSDSSLASTSDASRISWWPWRLTATIASRAIAPSARAKEWCVAPRSWCASRFCPRGSWTCFKRPWRRWCRLCVIADACGPCAPSRASGAVWWCVASCGTSATPLCGFSPFGAACWRGAGRRKSARASSSSRHGREECWRAPPFEAPAQSWTPQLRNVTLTELVVVLLALRELEGHFISRRARS